MTKQSSVEKIEEFNRFGSILGLERMNELLAELGNPEKSLNVIHVAGTNGKGSVCIFIDEMLQAEGYVTGRFSSPYLESFNERITVSGENISDNDLDRHSEKVLEAVNCITEKGHDSPTEFEVVTALAFLYFAEKKPDYVILEVGLGGRGDSTNVIEAPLITVITSIDFDHTERLGNTLAEIAGEKAGIIKKSVPVISNARQKEATDVIRAIAREKGSEFIDISDVRPEKVFVTADCTKFDVRTDNLSEYHNSGKSFSKNSAKCLKMNYGQITLSMLGFHQCENAKTALATVAEMESEGMLRISEKSIREGLKKAVHKGRMEVAGREPLVILDGAHNPAGAKMLAKTLDEISKNRRTVLVTGILKDKDVSEMSEIFNGFSDEIIVTQIDNERTMPAEKLAEYFSKAGKPLTVETNAEKAVRMALMKVKKGETVVIAGSLYLIGQIRQEVYDGS